MAIKEERAVELLDLLADRDMTWPEIEFETGWTSSQFQAAKQCLRDMLAADVSETVTLTAEPQGYLEPWLYCLKSGTEINDRESSKWVLNRLKDAERRVITIGHVMDVAVRVLSGRTTEGRKARVLRVHLKHAQEELAIYGDGEAG